MDGDITQASGNINTQDDFQIRGAVTRAPPQTAAKTRSQDACAICLEAITERAVAVPCNHLTFDFLCLVTWLQEQSTCPLCKSRITKVEYDFRSPEDYKTYHVPVEDTRSRNARTSQHSRPAHLNPRPRRRPVAQQTQPSTDQSLDRRRHIYRNRLYSLRVGANRISQYRDFTQQSFTTSPELQSRTRTFLRRELQIFSFLDANPRGGNRDFLVEYIVAILKTNELRGADGKTEELLKDVLGLENTRQLLHELEAWLRSPYVHLRDWDGHVQYADRRDTSK
ncbi:ring finger domain [Lecanosticta acicola]|uniref:RING-type E3 ubiquitin transferase n=1 Tax=Lecanosticta acicola TaxID=111012 RepID=A0AAI9E9X8_9PEZI|nr:ring finger domain [Lecanosticta acicola]